MNILYKLLIENGHITTEKSMLSTVWQALAFSLTYCISYLLLHKNISPSILLSHNHMCVCVSVCTMYSVISRVFANPWTIARNWGLKILGAAKLDASNYGLS